MAALAARHGTRRRSMNEINMVPFIDVMLVLLIIFMVSAPLISTGVVDLPSIGAAKRQPDHVIEIQVAGDGQLKVRVDSGEAQRVPLKDVAARVKAAQGGSANAPVVIAGDKSVKYESILQVMDTLQKAGVQRVGLSVKAGSTTN